VRGGEAGARRAGLALALAIAAALLAGFPQIGAFTAAFNVTGQPAVSLPAGSSKAGLPIGVQLVMKRGAERDLLGLAATLEQLLM